MPSGRLKDELLVTAAQLALSAGVKPSYVAKLKKDGKIAYRANRRFELTEALKVIRNIKAGSNRALTGDMAETTTRAKMEESLITVKTKELDYRKKAGELIERADVIEDAKEAGKAVKSKLYAEIAKLTPLLVGKPEKEIRKILTKSADEVMISFQRKLRRYKD